MMPSSRNSGRKPRFSPVLAALVLAASSAPALDLTVQVTDDKGEPAPDAVVTFTPRRGVPRVPPGEGEIVQIGKQFTPSVLVVPVGSKVRFPNRDEVAHHVYSFSDPKKFDLPLYTGEAAAPVVFDKPGVVTLGCNIHDWMVAHIFVSATPYHALTDAAGRAVVRGVPEGGGRLEVWHPRLRGKPVTVDLPPGRAGLEPVALPLRPEFRRRQAPHAGHSHGAYQ